MAYANSAERQPFIGGLRVKAGFPECQPGISAPQCTVIHIFRPYGVPDDGQWSAADAIASLIGPGIGTAAASRHNVTSRHLGAVDYRAVAIPSEERKEK